MPALTIQTDARFDALCQQFGGDMRRWPDRTGRYHGTCPNCGKAPFSKQGVPAHHWSIFPTDRGYAHRCFVCGFAGSLSDLLVRQGDTTVIPIAPAPRAPERPRYWQTRPAWYLEHFCAAPDRIEAWQRYKPFSLETIARWRFGVGVLPSSPCTHRRLIYPLFADDTIVGFRGRAIDCDCDKWISCGGTRTQLWGLELVRPGVEMIIVENPCDAALCMQVEPSVVAVASTSGAATWRDEWTAALVARKPKSILVWLDHDLAGNGSRYHDAEMVAAWRQKNPTAKVVPAANGPKIWAALRQAHLNAALYEWPKGTPFKQDVGSLLMEQMEGVA